MKYEYDFRVIDMATIEEILTTEYGDSEYARTAGCYANGNWFSIEKILSLLSDGAQDIDEYT